MSYKIKFTPQANQDIKTAIAYIAFVINNPTAANTLYILTTGKIKNLQDFPEKYPLVGDIALAHQQIRWYIPVDNYLVFYKINKLKEEIQILRFLYTKSNWLAILKHNKQTSAYPQNYLKINIILTKKKVNINASKTMPKPVWFCFYGLI